MEELSFITIIVIVLFGWFLFSQMKKSKTLTVLANSMQSSVELLSLWANSKLVDSATVSNMEGAKELAEKLEELSDLGITKSSSNKIKKDWGI